MANARAAGYARLPDRWRGFTRQETPMDCVIYKGRRKAHTYLYVEREDDFERVPSALLDLMGELEKVMELHLELNRPLVNADTGEVMQLLEAQGYYLQMPPEAHSPLHKFLS